MRLVTFTTGTRAERRLGLVQGGNQLIDLTRASAKPPFDPTDMVSLITGGERALSWLREAAARPAETVAIESVRLTAPIPRPAKNIFCVGWNYLEHFQEGAKARPNVEMPAHPAFFTKAPTAMNGPYDPIPLHAGITERLDWEVELAVIIGNAGTNVREADAMNHVFGYAVANDVSAREIQRQHGQQWFKGKSLDGLCPMGPWIATRDEIADPQDLRIACRVNGVTKQESNTSFMYFKIPRLIAELSAGLTLEPGDILLTGTPAGVGHARTPPEFMKSGDVMETEITGLGLLRNRIGE